MAIAMILDPRLNMPPTDHHDFMSGRLNLLGNLMSTVAWLHGDQCWSHVGQKRIEPIVGYSVNEIRFLVFRIECGKATSSVARSRPTASYAIDVSSVDRIRFLAMTWTP